MTVHGRQPFPAARGARWSNAFYLRNAVLDIAMPLSGKEKPDGAWDPGKTDRNSVLPLQLFVCDSGTYTCSEVGRRPLRCFLHFMETESKVKLGLQSLWARETPFLRPGQCCSCRRTRDRSSSQGMSPQHKPTEYSVSC